MPLLLLLLACGGSQNTRTDMATFDQAYIPALVLTAERGTTAEAVMSVNILKQEWNLFKTREQDLLAASGTINDVDKHISDADLKVVSGNAKGASADLKNIRLILMDVRRTRGIPYFLDFLTDYSVPMEAIADIADAAHGRKGALSDAELRTITRKAEEAKAKWKEAQDAEFRPAEFGMNEDGVKALGVGMKRIETGLGRLEAALKLGDRDMVLEAALALRPDFMRIYKMFGNFMRPSV